MLKLGTDIVGGGITGVWTDKLPTLRLEIVIEGGVRLIELREGG